MPGRALGAVSPITSGLATTLLVALRPELDAETAILLVVLAFAGWAVAVVVMRAARDPRAVVVVIVVVLAAAVTLPPRGSRDLWGYAAYGRIVSEHGASPYTRVPAAFPHDRLLPLMGGGYRHTRSPYGPAFTAVSAAGTGLVGDDARASRLFFQGLEAIAVAVALLVLWRRTRRVDALVWVGLNPLVVTTIVNDGHNDGLVMLGVLAAVVLAASRRPYAAGLVLGVAALVKLPALLALGGLGLWVWHRHGARDAARTVTAGAVTVTLGYTVVGTAALESIGDSGQLVSRATIWTPVHDLLVGAGHPWLVDSLPTIALVAVLGLATLLACSGRSQPDPAEATAGTASSFALAGAYVLPWYATWGLATFATRRPGPLAWLVAAQGALLVVAYQLPHHAAARANGLFVHRLVTDVLPLLVLVVAVIIGLRGLAASAAGPSRLRFAGGRRLRARAVRASASREPRSRA